MGVAVLTSKINDSTAICRKLLEETLKQRRYSEYVEFADTVGLLQSLDCCRYGTVILRYEREMVLWHAIFLTS